METNSLSAIGSQTLGQKLMAGAAMVEAGWMGFDVTAWIAVGWNCGVEQSGSSLGS
jgi:hypothetical protein